MAVSAALPVAPTLTNEAAVPGAPTARAAPARGPARGKQRRLALILAAVAFEELGHRKSRLKLHSIHRHGTPPASVRPPSPPRWLSRSARRGSAPIKRAL